MPGSPRIVIVGADTGGASATTRAQRFSEEASSGICSDASFLASARFRSKFRTVVTIFADG